MTGSAKANIAFSDAQIRSRASTVSSPAARQSPRTAASVGNGSRSLRRIISLKPTRRSSACSALRPWKTSSTCAPALKFSPSARTSSARISAASASTVAASSSPINSMLNRFSGGSASVMTPTSPSRSNLTLVMS